MGKLEDRVDNYYQIGVDIHELAFNASKLYYAREATFDDKRTLINRIFMNLVLHKDKELEVKYTPAFEFLSEWIPKLNATSELLKQGEDYRKTGSLEPAHPALLGGWDSNPRPIGYTKSSVSRKRGLYYHPRQNLINSGTFGCGALPISLDTRQYSRKGIVSEPSISFSFHVNMVQETRNSLAAGYHTLVNSIRIHAIHSVFHPTLLLGAAILQYRRKAGTALSIQPTALPLSYHRI